MFMSVAGVPIDEFKGKGAEFVADFKPRLGGKDVDPYAIYGAQAAELMLNAISESDGSRSDIIAKLFEQKINDGYLGTFQINENGDPGGAEGAVVGFTIYKATDKLETETTISPSEEVVEAARG
jgi:ABC-type branched-subunit amino acid transport system substrate-binding protein